ncbi:hypothetical protein KP509_38G067100 [Ceratopteris richardii]|uniref:Proline dehydrogenase n=1 Tax=Ceratopteris richardii TaxID=49495 RepID=A0A8T2Q5Q7_CERRI|nr:hypothetical protein KP509_38G067100 [Ceratopteris richardii]
MAWQVSRLSSASEKRLKLPRLKHSRDFLGRSIIFNGELERSLPLVSKREQQDSATLVSKKDVGYFTSPALSWLTFKSKALLSSPPFLPNEQAFHFASTGRLFRESLGYPWTNGTSLGSNAWSAAQSLFKKPIKTFAPANRSTSGHVQRIHDFPILSDELREKAMANVLNTEDGQFIYSGMSTSELLFTLFNLKLVAHEPLVVLSTRLLKSPLMNFAWYRRPLLSVVKRTAYSHFCAGEDVAEASQTIQRMWELGLKSILDYSLEDATDNASCDSNLKGFLQTVDRAKQFPRDLVSFSCVKLTALCPLPLLERISSLLRWQHMHPDVNLPWREDVLPFLVDESPLYHVTSQPEPLTQDEERDLDMAKNRLWKLCKACDVAGLPLLVDAEYTTVQPAIDYFTYLAAAEFNRNDVPLVYGTIQAYLKDSFPRLSTAAKEAAKRQINFGVKLVRGAYISRESALAASLGAESPIHSSIGKTHKCYDSCAAFMMQHAANAQGSVVLATHNFNSGRAAAAQAENLGLLRGNPRLQFAQLKGMADALSLALAHAGFRVSKYLPFGPVDHVVPYLLRRAEENRGLLGNTGSDCFRIRKEIKRRLLLQL